MFSTKPRKLTLTLFTYVALVFALSALSDAKGYAPVPQRRDHVDLNRMLRKRGPPPSLPIIGAGSDPKTVTDSAATGSSSAISSSSLATSTTTSAATTSVASTTSSAATSAPTSSSTSTSTSTSASSTSSSSSSTSSSSSSSTSTSTSSSSSTSSSTKTSAATTETAAATTAAAAAATTPVAAGTTMFTPASKTVSTSTIVAAASATDDSSATPSSSTSKVTKATVTVIVVIAACVGGTAIIWTVIRKWKFRPSAEFEDRMQPIDWQPTDAGDSGLPGHHRAASHGSFQSGGHGDESNMAGRGMGGGYGATSDHGHGTGLQPIPDHDFTAVVPGGGYADMARGPSPQPPMQELARGPSLTRGNYDYGVPLHHQGGYQQDAYDYNGAGAGARY